MPENNTNVAAPVSATNQQTTQRTNNNNTSNSHSPILRREAVDVNKVLAENEQLRNKLKIAQKANEEIKQVNDNLSKRVSDIEFDRRKERIASLLSGATYKQEEFDAKVDTFAKSGLPVEEIESIITPLIAASKVPENNNQTESPTNDNNSSNNNNTPTVKHASGCSCNSKNNNNEGTTKSASYGNSRYSTKVAIRNARLEDADNNNTNDNVSTSEAPAFLVSRNYLFNGGAT